MEITELKCSKCGEVKPVSSFYKHESYSSGYKTQCITCLREYMFDYNRKQPKKKYNIPYLPIDEGGLYNITTLNMETMFNLLDKMGYKKGLDIHQQFCERHNLPIKPGLSHNAKYRVYKQVMNLK